MSPTEAFVSTDHFFRSLLAYTVTEMAKTSTANLEQGKRVMGPGLRHAGRRGWP
jgi:hypothetical protein